MDELRKSLQASFNKVAFSPALPVAVGTEYLIQQALGKYLNYQNKSLKNISNKDINKAVKHVKDKYKVDVEAGTVSDFNNAQYEPAENLLTSSLNILDPTMSESLGRHGRVTLGGTFKKPHILAHELGHAVAKNKGSALERATHSDWLNNALVDKARYLTPVAGALIGAAIGDESKDKSLIGSGIGLLAGAALGSAPMLAREYFANSRGAEILKDLKQDKIKPPSNLPAYLSYLLPGVALGAMIPAHIATNGFSRW